MERPRIVQADRRGPVVSDPQHNKHAKWTAKQLKRYSILDDFPMRAMSSAKRVCDFSKLRDEVEEMVALRRGLPLARELISALCLPASDGACRKRGTSYRDRRSSTRGYGESLAARPVRPPIGAHNLNRVWLVGDPQVNLETAKRHKFRTAATRRK